MIFCCGEALVDMIAGSGPEGSGTFTAHAGGAVFNTAISLGRLGMRPGFISGISTDMFGTLLSETLRESGVSTDHVLLSDLPTTLAFVSLVEGQAKYMFYDENTAGRSLSSDRLPDLPEGTEALYFGGISLISEPGADFYAALAQREAERHVIMIDPNIRPGFIRDEPVYRARLDRMIAVSDILKVSDEDLDWLLPGDMAMGDKARQMIAKGPGMVIVTRGGEGAVAFLSGGIEVAVPSQRVTVVDTVGAGDTFNAGVLAKLSERGLLDKAACAKMTEEDARAALTHGAAVAAITVSRAGANPPWAAELGG